MQRLFLGIEKVKDSTEITSYLQKALNYLDTFWTNILAYTKDGSYPIDNNVAERVVHPLTTQRNAMLHFGSDEGAKMVATYHSIISTVKLQGRSAWDYLGKFFVNIFNSYRDFFGLRPDNIGLATCQ
ncbi:MAG: transposase [Sanguibacteroides justesenii]|uniref:IS66 family transposase n=1 Tax=Butyricimonas faecalis TaxID=2093856 RepID=UPI001D954657|nr:transposase [Sanguibacteroides justesenii]